MGFGYVPTPAKHVLLVHMNMLQGLKIYQGSKIKHVYKHTNISSGNECNWTNTEQLVFTKPCPQKGSMKT